MQIQINQSLLKRALSIVSKGANTRVGPPVLNNVLIEAQAGGEIRLTTNNLTFGITYRTDCDVQQAGAVTVPFKLLQEFVQKAPSAVITLSAAGGRITVTCRQQAATFPTIPADVFPLVPAPSGQPLAVMPVPCLREMIPQVACAASTDQQEVVLRGILMRFEGRGLTMAAGDRRRLAERAGDCLLCGPPEPTRIVVPATALTELARSLQTARIDGGNVRLFVTPAGKAIFEAGPLTMTAHLLEDNFPNYQLIIPTVWKTRIIAPRQEMLKALESVATISHGRLAAITLTVMPAGEEQPGQVIVSARDIDSGAGNEVRITANVEGPGIQTNFDPRYASAALEAIPTMQAALELEAPAAPGVFRPVGSNHYFHIVMPLHLNVR